MECALKFISATILKGLTMHTQKDHCFFFSRRNFILATFMYPFLIGNLMADNKTREINPLSSNKEDEFVILGGWVLLKDDLIENPSLLFL